MDTSSGSCPFGLIFEEPVLQLANSLTPTYDEDTGLSYVLDSEGKRVPYVGLSGVVGTETSTKASTESIDQDEDSRVAFTGTVTAEFVLDRTKQMCYVETA